MVIEKNTISNDPYEESLLSETLKVLEQYSTLIKNNNYVLKNGETRYNGFTNLLKLINNKTEELLNIINSPNNSTSKSTLIFNEPLTEKEIYKRYERFSDKDRLTYADGGKYYSVNYSYEFKFDMEDWKRFLDTRQQSYETPCQVIWWNNISIDRSGNDTYQANGIAKSLKEKGYYTRVEITKWLEEIKKEK